MIPFNRPSITGKEFEYIGKVLDTGKFSGDRFYSRKCCNWLENNFKAIKALMTPSCTHVLEMGELLADI
jgi:dTDP-4-amino-4,6-dideoxygalactose transaminase